MGKPGAVSQPPDHRQVFLVPTSPRGLAKHGSKGVVGGGSADGGAMHQVVVAWQEAHARLGHHLALGARRCSRFHCSIAACREQGIRAAGQYDEEYLKMCGPLRLVRALTEQLWHLSATSAGSPTSLVGPTTSCSSPCRKTCGAETPRPTTSGPWWTRRKTCFKIPIRVSTFARAAVGMDVFASGKRHARRSRPSRR